MATPGRNIVIRDSAGIPRRDEPVRVSVPFARGELCDPQQAGVLDPQGLPVPLQSSVLGRWSDGSVSWLLCDFQATVPARGESRYRVGDALPPPPTAGIAVTPGAESWRVDTGSALFVIDARVLRPFLSVRVGGRERLASSGSRSLLAAADGSLFADGKIESVLLGNPGPLAATLSLGGSFAPAARFTLRLHFHAGKSHCLVEFTLHNPRAARHPGGRWDLGDGGSFFFRELSLSLPFAEAPASPALLVPEAGGEPLFQKEPQQRLSILQESSGGQRRLSPNHLAAGGRLACTPTGFRVACGAETLARGERALPTLWSPAGESGVLLFLPRFWQEFPKGLEAEQSSLKASLFPAGMPEPYELQGGERKCSQLWIDFDAPEGAGEWLRSPLLPVLEPEAYRLCGIFPDLPPAEPGEDLVEEFLPGPETLFLRREEIDEYGWRNFGDFYADHEAVYHRGEEPFVSHYNNQYDLLAGLYRKFFASGDPRWGELAADLARHLVDIDLYHTEEDREEYNHGLFWHTDHYISAGLATHRTFSAVHLGVKDPRFFGGGPGAEHCYTSGLLLSYYLTGSPVYREAVVELADWCYRSLTGPHTLLAAAKRGASYLSMLRHDRGSVFPDHPLTRGTGNAVNATLDALQLTGDRKYLLRAEALIRGALHPEEEIGARDMLSPEAAWSYTVLLVAVAKFLCVKLEREEIDAGYAYARAALLHYARWMRESEYPYLEKTELLEYPNETWAAQELRKCVVLYHAAGCAPQGERESLLDKARLLLDAARRDLRRFPTSSCTRPVALMLQNGWVAQALQREPAVALPAPPSCPFGPPTPRLGAASVARRLQREFSLALRETGLKRELNWLKARLS